MLLPIEAVEAAIRNANSAYYRLVLLVGQRGSGKTAVLKDLAASVNKDVLNVGLLLSQRLLESPIRQRPLVLPTIFEEIIEDKGNVVLLDNLEVLFDVSLRQDPLRLLQNVSRHRTVVASWTGSITNDKLLYAVPGHPEFRNYPLHDTIYISLDAGANMISK